MSKAKYQMIIQWSDEDNCFLVAFPDFPSSYWRTHGDTDDDAFANGKERTCPHLALESLIAAYESTGEVLPIPKLAYSA